MRPVPTGKPPDTRAPWHGPYYLDSLHCDYFGRIADAPDFHPELKKYLMRWQELEGRPEVERLVRATVYWVTDASPRMGETEPRDVKIQTLFTEP